MSDLNLDFDEPHDYVEPPKIEMDYSEEDSAALIHDEIGLPEMDLEQSLDQIYKASMNVL